MESWFLADPDSLKNYYSQGFLAASLPRNPRVEEIPRADVVSGLKNATRNAKIKGPYHKTHHGFELLAQLDPSRVELAAPFAKRFFDSVRDYCNCGSTGTGSE
jgi:hypothetical protein